MEDVLREVRESKNKKLIDNFLKHEKVTQIAQLNMSFFFEEMSYKKLA
jgi:hypothetical protein